LLLIINEFKRYRNSGPWGISDEFFSKLTEVMKMDPRKKLDPLILSMKYSNHRIMLRHLSLFILPYTKLIEINDVTEAYAEKEMEYLCSFIKFSLHEKQEKVFLNGIPC
jgi:hypothetical protein